MQCTQSANTQKLKCFVCHNFQHTRYHLIGSYQAVYLGICVVVLGLGFHFIRLTLMRGISTWLVCDQAQADLHP